MQNAERLETLIWELRRTFRLLAEQADEALAPLGLCAGDRAVLEFLSREAEPVSISELARKRHVSRQHIHQALSRLPDQGWIVRTEDSADRRLTRIRLSPSGRAAWQRVRAVDARLLRELGSHFHAAELESGLQLLRKLQQEAARRSPGGRP